MEPPPVKYNEVWNGKTSQDKRSVTFVESAKAMAVTGPLNLLLVCLPLAIISYCGSFPDAATFLFSLLALAPLAERLGFVTEQLALHTNDSIGGLLNATFGNATELIVAISALNKGLYRLVQLSLLGSILSNLLLVLGTAFFLGGMRFKTQRFAFVPATTSSTLLVLSTMAVLFPTALTYSGQESPASQLGLSRATSLLLFLLYGAFLYFQIHTHKYLYDDADDGSDADDEEKNRGGSIEMSALGTRDSIGLLSDVDEIKDEDHTDSGASDNSLEPTHSPLTAFSSPKPKLGVDAIPEEAEDEEEDELGLFNALFWLALVTVFIAVLSEALSASIEQAAKSAGISGIFIAAILLPIVGNAAEHAGAIVFAMKGKLDLSLGIAVGSSMQIALCVLPLLVLLGWITGHALDLNFGAYEATSLLLSVIVVAFALKDGKAHWLLGAALVTAYAIIALGFAFHKASGL